MKKYSKEQIEKAFLDWNKDCSGNKENYGELPDLTNMTDEEIESHSKVQSDHLFTFID